MLSQVAKQIKVWLEVDLGVEFLDAQLMQLGKHAAKDATKGRARTFSANQIKLFNS